MVIRRKLCFSGLFSTSRASSSSTDGTYTTSSPEPVYAFISFRSALKLYPSQNFSVFAESRICYFLNFHGFSLLIELLFHSFIRCLFSTEKHTTSWYAFRRFSCLIHSTFWHFIFSGVPPCPAGCRTVSQIPWKALLLVKPLSSAIKLIVWSVFRSFIGIRHADILQICLKIDLRILTEHSRKICVRISEHGCKAESSEILFVMLSHISGNFDKASSLRLFFSSLLHLCDPVGGNHEIKNLVKDSPGTELIAWSPLDTYTRYNSWIRKTMRLSFSVEPVFICSASVPSDVKRKVLFPAKCFHYETW